MVKAASQSASSKERNDQLTCISLKSLTSPDAKTSSDEVAHLYNVCRTSGFFFLVDHDIPSSLLSRVRIASRNFFELPEETKEIYGHDSHHVVPKSCRGYSGTERLNPNDMEKKQVFDLGIGRTLVPGVPFTGGNVLPPDDVAPDFAKSNLELQHQLLKGVIPQITRALARALKIEDGPFEKMMDVDVVTLIQRVIYYPPGRGRAGKHTDNGIFTVLIQETAESRSLQVYSEGSWVPVEAKEEMFVVNLGDTLQYLTNKMFVSTPHRVIHSAPYSRVSLPFFVYPNIHAKVVPIGQEGDEEKVRLVSDIMTSNFSSIWTKGTGAGRALELQ